MIAGELAALVERLLDGLLPEQDFRVFIDRAPSYEVTFRELRSQDIYSYVIAQGRYAFGISLGVYSPESTALEAQQSIQAKDIR